MKRFNCKKMLAVFLSVLLLTGLMATSAMGVSAAPVAYTDIEADETLTVTLTVSQSTKYLRFIPEEDGEYIFYSTGYMDTYGVLLDADEEILYSDDDSGEDYNFNIRYFLYAGNVYYLSLSIYGDGTGIFDVTAEAADIGFEVDAVLTVDEGITATNIPVDEPSYFSFTPEWSGWYTMYTTGDADTYGKLVDGEGNGYIFNDNTIDEDNFSITYYFEEGITYYLIVWGYGGWTVNYDLYVDAVSIYDLFVNAETIEVDETWTCTAASDGDHLYFRFMPEVSGEYSFTTASDADPYCYFYDADYGGVYYVDDTDEMGANFTFNYYYEAGCPYYFMLGDWNAETSFTVTLESVSEEPEIVSINAGETVTVTAAVQEFVFTPEEDGWYVFTSSGSCDTCIDIYGYPHISNNNNGDGKNFRAVAYCYADEEYSFVTRMMDYIDPYPVSVNAVAESHLFPDVQTIRVGDTPEVYLDAESGCPIYRFVPTVGGEYTLYTTGEADSYCYLYDTDRDEVVSADDYFYGGDCNLVLTYDFVAGETYYFQFSAYYDEEPYAEYEVHLQSGGFDTLKAEQIFEDVTRTVYPPHPEASQYFAFVPAESGWYNIALGVDGFLSCSIRDAYDSPVSETDNGDEADDFDVVCYLEGGEVYYLELSTYGEDVPMYTVTVSEADVNQLFPDAVTITSGQTKSVFEGQYYRFVPTVSGVYTFYSSGNSDAYCTLYDTATGSVEHYDDVDYEGGDYNFSLTYPFVAGQVYYFYTSFYELDGETDPYVVTLSFDHTVSVVDSIRVDGLRAPQAGETVLDYYYAIGDVTTDPSLLLGDMAVFQGDALLEEGTVFAAGETYTIGLAFDEEANEVLFAEGCTATVTGYTIQICEKIDNWCVVFVNITIPADEPDVLLGDADGNGRVNNRDLGLLQQYLNDWNVSFDLAVCDMDGNGRVNNRDLGLLQQLLNA